MWNHLEKKYKNIQKKNMWYIHTQTHTHTGALLSHKKEWNFTICSSVDGSREDYA